jgi:hypothetical protein
MNAQGARSLFAETRTDANFARSMFRRNQLRTIARGWAEEAPPRIVDKFTRLLEQDLPMFVIARRMNIGETKAEALLARIRRELGWQAR